MRTRKIDRTSNRTAPSNLSTRRDFLGRTAAAITAPYIVPASVLGLNGATPPSERITLGSIGVGGRGSGHINTFLGHQDTQILAVCDPIQAKCDLARKTIEKRYASNGGIYKGCATYQDFRELIARDDIDAVVIASPEYWHGLHATMAMAAGKDVYGEKAMTLTVAQGQVMKEKVRRYGRIFQLGTQQRSDRNFRFACELARNGYLGKLHTVKVGVPGGRALPVTKPAPIPAGLDYEMWLGPAPYTPYNELKCTFNWYFINDYCVGWIQSWGVHHIDTAQWGVPTLATGKVKVKGSAVFPEAGLADTSITWNVDYHTADGVHCNFTDNAVNPQGVRFEGDEGWVHVDRGGINAGPKSLLDVTLKPNEEHLYVSENHHTNFTECIRSRKDPVAPVEAGHSATTLTLIGDIATRLKRELTWDWATETFVNDDDANRMLSRPMRSPWQI